MKSIIVIGGGAAEMMAEEINYLRANLDK